MRMNVFEMEGFLRGKCVPRDLKGQLKALRVKE